MGVGFSKAAGDPGGGGVPWDWDVDFICARIAARGVCGGHPLIVKRDLDFHWYYLFFEVWGHDPLSRDWEAAKNGFKPPARRKQLAPVTVDASTAFGTPTYQDILIEFERRTASKPKPVMVLPSTVDLFSEFERRTGKKI